MYKSCLKLRVTIVVLHCNILRAYFGKQSYQASVPFDFCTWSFYFIYFIRSFTGVKSWVKDKIAPCNSVAPFSWELLCSLHYYVQTLWATMVDFTALSLCAMKFVLFRIGYSKIPFTFCYPKAYPKANTVCYSFFHRKVSCVLDLQIAPTDETCSVSGASQCLIKLISDHFFPLSRDLESSFSCVIAMTLSSAFLELPPLFT